jgi:hypothetical protein
MQDVSVSIVLQALSNAKAAAIFDSVAVSEVDRKFLLIHLNLTPKEYYSRITCLLKAGLITRINGKYYITSFGKVISHAQAIIGIALADYWKLSAIDSLQSSHSLPFEEFCRIVNNLVTDNFIRQVLTHSTPISVDEPQNTGDLISAKVLKHRGRTNSKTSGKVRNINA